MDDRLSIKPNGLYEAWSAAGRGRFLRRSADDETPLASPSTLCRLENRIGEQQLMLFADRTSCHEFEANQFRLLLSSLAYVLVQQLRQHHLATCHPYQTLFRDITSSLVLRPG